MTLLNTQAVCDTLKHVTLLNTQAVRDSEWEVGEITRTRTNQEQNITLETPYYDIVRIKASTEQSVLTRRVTHMPYG